MGLLERRFLDFFVRRSPRVEPRVLPSGRSKDGCTDSWLLGRSRDIIRSRQKKGNGPWHVV